MLHSRTIANYKPMQENLYQLLQASESHFLFSFIIFIFNTVLISRHFVSQLSALHKYM